MDDRTSLFLKTCSTYFQRSDESGPLAVISYLAPSTPQMFNALKLSKYPVSLFSRFSDSILIQQITLDAIMHAQISRRSNQSKSMMRMRCF